MSLVRIVPPDEPDPIRDAILEHIQNSPRPTGEDADRAMGQFIAMVLQHGIDMGVLEIDGEQQHND